MRNKIAAIVIVAALAWGLEQVVVSPLETGAVYPEYSSLRTDPMGAMALYESLGKILKVDRLYKSRTRSDPGPGTTIFVLGVEPVAWAKLKTETLEEYEHLTRNGARLVIAFLPVTKPWVDKDKRPVEQRWDIHFTYKDLKVGLELRGGPNWKTFDGAWERPLGAGSVVLLADSYPLSNEGLREEHEAALIVKLVGNATEVEFDENHFGVVDTGSIAKLMRKYNLEGALAVLALVAGLFLWRNASSLLPSQAPRAERAVTGRDSLEGMTVLLRRGIAEKDLIRICYEEWKKTSPENTRAERFVDHKNVVEGYRKIAKALVEKT